MKQAEELGPEEQEWQHLVDAYALGELDEQGMQRLYDLLRDDTNGARIAGMAWDSLNMRGNIRTALDPSFRDLIADRIEQQADTDDSQDDRGFIGSILAGIGIHRPRLKSVRVDVPTSRPRPLLWLAGIILLAAIAICAVFFMRGDPNALAVEAINGQITCVGKTVADGDRIGSSIIQVDNDSDIVVRWDNGHRARIAGPASFSANPEGLSLITGYARVVTADVPLIIGLTDRRIIAAPQSDVLLEANHAAPGRCAVISGSTKGERGDQVIHMDANRWSNGEQSWPWLNNLTWNTTIPTVEGPAWHCDMRLSFTNIDDVATLRRNDQDILHIQGCELNTPNGEQHQLEMPPGKQRTISISAAIADLTVSVDGQRTTILIPGNNAPQELVLNSGATLHAGLLRNGPPLLAKP